MADTTTENKDTVTTDGQPSPPSPSNPDRVQHARDEFQEETNEKRRAQQESQSLADKVLEARQQRTVDIELEGHTATFNILIGDGMDRVEDILEELDQLVEEAEAGDWDEREDEAEAKAEAYRDELLDILVEKSVDDSLDHQFWPRAYGRNNFGKYVGKLYEKSQTADMSEEELKRFRQE